MRKGNWQEFLDPNETGTKKATEPLTPKSDLHIIVERTRSGKGVKTVTLVTGLERDPQECRALLKLLKKKAATGGTLKPNCIELQGDHVSLTMKVLNHEGYKPKQSGG